MIRDLNRAYYFGASDTERIMGNWQTKTFSEWWDVKRGFRENNVETIYTLTGNAFEPKILDFLDCEDRDRQIVIDRLRVNYDGIIGGTVIEVKTHKFSSSWKMPKAYWQQCQVEMYAGNFDICLLKHYGLLEEDYHDWSRPIDENRLGTIIIHYDEKWIEDEYIPRLLFLTEKLKKGENIESNFKKQK